MAYSSLILKSLSDFALRTDVGQLLSGSLVPKRASNVTPHNTGTAQQERAVACPTVRIGFDAQPEPKRNTRPARREPRRNARSKSKDFAARAVTPYAKAAKGFPRRLVRCVFTWRCAASIRNRTRCLFLFGRTASMEAGVLPVCRANDPR
jgi:hypothetical protein